MPRAPVRRMPKVEDKAKMSPSAGPADKANTCTFYNQKLSLQATSLLSGLTLHSHSCLCKCSSGLEIV